MVARERPSESRIGINMEGVSTAKALNKRMHEMVNLNVSLNASAFILVISNSLCL